MIYLSHFLFPSREREYDFTMSQKRTCYDTFYPFGVVSKHGLRRLDFEDITILYGSNGSGKTTALNIIAERLGLARDTLYNRSNFFADYIKLCDWESAGKIPRGSRIITSDDVFDFMLNIRSINDGIHEKREELFEEYLDAKYSDFQLKSLEDYEQLKRVNFARNKRNSQSKYVRSRLMDNVQERSNGESAFFYFTEKIKANGLYLLDEPENSLSPDRQIELVKYLSDSARFFACQLIISTHSPFLLSMKGAKIYDMDAEPADVKPWTELPNIRAYYAFFQEHSKEFQRSDESF